MPPSQNIYSRHYLINLYALSQIILMMTDSTEGKRILTLIGYVLAIYICSLTAAVFEEKIYKVPYAQNAKTEGESKSDLFTDSITPLGFSSGLACILGYFMLKQDELDFNVSAKNIGKVAVSDVLIHICLVLCLLRTNYTTIIVVNSLSLFSVVIVATYFTGSDNNQSEQTEQASPTPQNDKIGIQKIFTCIIVCFGVIVFAAFSSNTQSQKQQQTAGGICLTIVLFAIAIIFEGLRPEFVAQIKRTDKPHPLFLYFATNGLIAVIILALSLCTWKIKYFVSFVLQHDRFILDLTVYSLLASISSMFAFKLVSAFRQHVYPLVSISRKYLTICVNVIWFGHHLTLMQWLGILIVAVGILREVIVTYNLKSKILPNKDIRNKEGKNYNKLFLREEDILTEEVEGI